MWFKQGRTVNQFKRRVVLLEASSPLKGNKGGAAE